ncbi:MAG: hypothetical protein WC940_02905 [Candidatus Paceibacterota bacterium]|jgi:hypothetical protein
MKNDVYDGYLHTNGTIQVKRMVFGASLIDLNSPFVKEYLGKVSADSYEEARDKLTQQINSLNNISVVK